jgi:hemoglobin/transferrin/lactoferrin receptor protein
LNYHQGPWKIKGNYRFNSAKLLSEYGGSADNPELATANGSLAWSTLNIYTSYAYKNIEVSLALENIFDKHYRLFASGVSAPGRNLIFSLRGSF